LTKASTILFCVNWVVRHEALAVKMMGASRFHRRASCQIVLCFNIIFRFGSTKAPYPYGITSAGQVEA